MATKEAGEGETSAKDEYFLSYGDLSVHELMLKDGPRTLAYKKAIEDNAALFKDKIVIDVGAGTGVLSLFAAKAGAKQVFAIEASAIADVCQQIVDQNNFQDKITVIRDKVETAELPSDVKADIIISEWMGFYLLHESMLDSVIFARDKWLKSDGTIFPSSASLYLCPVNMKTYINENWNFWSDFHGFDFSPVMSLVKSKTQQQPVITTIESNQLVAEPQLVTHLDMMFINKGDLSVVDGIFHFAITANSVLHGFASWFNVEFEGDKTSKLCTGPSDAKTHWEQTVMFLPHPLLVSKQDTVSCKLALTQGKDNPRQYNICIELDEAEDSDDANIDNNVDIDNDVIADDVQLAMRDHIINALEKNVQHS